MVFGVEIETETILIEKNTLTLLILFIFISSNPSAKCNHKWVSSHIWNRCHDILPLADHVWCYMEVFQCWFSVVIPGSVKVLISSSMANIQETARWQFCRKTHLPLFSASWIIFSAIGPWPWPNEMDSTLRERGKWKYPRDHVQNTDHFSLHPGMLLCLLTSHFSSLLAIACMYIFTSILSHHPNLMPPILSILFYLSRQPLSFAKRWKAPIGSDPVLRMKISGVEGDISL